MKGLCSLCVCAAGPPPTCLSISLQLLSYQFDRVMFHIRGDNVRNANTSILALPLPFLSLCTPAAPPVVLQSRVEHQVVGLKQGGPPLSKIILQTAANKWEWLCVVSFLMLFLRHKKTWRFTSVPPEVKMMSSALPPTILATFSLAWLMMALALMPKDNKTFSLKLPLFFL